VAGNSIGAGATCAATLESKHVTCLQTHAASAATVCIDTFHTLQAAARPSLELVTCGALLQHFACQLVLGLHNCTAQQQSKCLLSPEGRTWEKQTAVCSSLELCIIKT
jgi:hypothetical protein